MKISKRHIILGIICLISAILRCISGISIIIPYLAFCLCSFIAGVKGKKTFGIINILLLGLVGLPFLEFVYIKFMALFMASFMPTLLTSVLTLLVQTCGYFGSFILVNSLINKEKFSFSLITGILTVSCIGIYSVLGGLQSFAFFNAMNQAVQQGTLFDLLNVVGGGNLLVNILSGIVFYMALWCTSIRFIKEK